MLQKKLILILFGIALLFFSEDLLAQFPGMKQVNSQMNSQFMNQQMNMMHMNMSMRSRASNSSKIPGAENEYTYKVVMKDGSQQTVTSYIYFDTLQKKSYLLLVDKRYPRSDTAHRKVKIYSTQTISISRDATPPDPDDSTARRVWFDGMATDSCWLFNAVKGKINLYSFVSELGNSYLFDPSTIAAVQYGSGAIGKFEPDALKAFIGNDEKAMKYFNKKDYFDAVKRYNKDAAKSPD